MKHVILSSSLLAGLFMTAHSIQAATPTVEELWNIIQQQQAEIEALKKQQQSTEQKAVAADVKAEAAVEAIEETAMHPAGTGSWTDRTHIGGYGELHYNNIDADDSANDVKEMDLHRFVLFFGHEFNDRIRLFSELEVEHGGVEADGDPLDGEVEVEQAYIEFDLNDNLQAKGGVFLLPVGILNETHEPATFYGVERNDVESIIIPSTWWAGGAGLSGHYASGLSWDLAVHEGLKIPTDSFRVRSGRQKVSNANAEDLAYTGRVKYSGIPGLELAASLHYQSDASQAGGDGLNDGLLFETHAVYQNGPFALRALYAEWNFDGSSVEAAGADEQKGWYLEPSFKPRKDLGLYARYEDIEAARSRDKFDQWEIGLNYWPHEDVVLKADYRNRDHDLSSESGRNFDAFDIGIGYHF
jgi:hypothetical protein